MPNYTFCGDTDSSWDYITIPSITQVQQEYAAYQQDCVQHRLRWERAHEEEMLRLEEERQERERIEEDKKKYPLFFLKEGII